MPDALALAAALLHPCFPDSPETFAPLERLMKERIGMDAEEDIIANDDEGAA